MFAYRDVVLIAEGALPALRRAHLDTVGRALRCVGHHVAAWSRSSDAARVDSDSDGRSYYVKRYHNPKVNQRLWSAFSGESFKRDRALREYDALRRLERAGVPVVRPVAAGSRKRFGLLRSCFLITETFDRGVPLSRLIGEGRVSHAERTALVAELAACVSHMHRLGIIHGQLFARNVLVRGNGPRDYDVCFLDFADEHRVRRKGLRLTHDLGALGSLACGSGHRSDCVRFVRAYRGTRRLDAAGRELLRSAARIASAHKRAELRRARMEAMFVDEQRIHHQDDAGKLRQSVR